jgi:hypothetical protein
MRSDIASAAKTRSFDDARRDTAGTPSYTENADDRP